MGSYKLVPMEPTEEMIDAARDQHEGEPYLPASLYKAMLAAAPDVQGEPVAVMYEDGSLLSKADCGDNFEICCKVQTPLYTAPQPTEQKPCPDVSALVEALEGLMRLESRGRIMPVGPEWDAARSALAAFRQGGGE